MNRRKQGELGMTWVKGCAIGCGIASVLLILLAVSGVYFVRYGMEAGMRAMTSDLKQQLAEARAKETVSAEEEAVFTESLSLVEQGKTDTVTAIILLTIWEKFKETDGAWRQSLLDATRDLNKFIAANPNAGMVKTIEFADKHPVLKKLGETEDGKTRWQWKPEAGGVKEDGESTE